jgi:hypothetical protein
MVHPQLQLQPSFAWSFRPLAFMGVTCYLPTILYLLSLLRLTKSCPWNIGYDDNQDPCECSRVNPHRVHTTCCVLRVSIFPDCTIPLWTSGNRVKWRNPHRVHTTCCVLRVSIFPDCTIPLWTSGNRVKWRNPHRVHTTCCVLRVSIFPDCIIRLWTSGNRVKWRRIRLM